MRITTFHMAFEISTENKHLLQATELEIVKRKLRWLGHVVSVKGTLANTTLQSKPG